MYKNILVPLDRSDFAERALPYALGVAGASAGAVHLGLVHFLPLWGSTPEVPTTIYEEADAKLRAAETEYLQTLGTQLTATTGIQAWPHLLDGMIVPALRDFAESEPADLIIMSTHGHGGLKRAWLGSVTDALLRASTIPMLLVRPAEDLGNAVEATTAAAETTPEPAPPKPEVHTPRRFAHMLIAVDGSTIADDAARRACELASLHGAKVTLLRVVRPPIHTTSAYMPHMMRLNREEVERRETEATVQLQELASELREDGLRVGERVVVDYHPAEAILREADDLDADVIALATRGHGGFKRLVLGSVADKVIRGSNLPVFVVPAHVAESLEDEKQREEEHAITVV